MVPPSPAENEKIPDIVKPKDLFDRLGKKPEDFKDHVMSIMVHEADPLPTDVHVRNPLVRVSFIGMQLLIFLYY